MSRDRQTETMPPCGGNDFCNTLADGDRQSLCAICTLRSFEKGEELRSELFHNHLMLLLDGVMATVKSTTGQLQYIYLPVDIFASEYLFCSDLITMGDYGLMRALRPLRTAFFPAAALRELFMSRSDVAKALYANLSTLYNQKCFYRLMVEMDDAYHAVHYMLLYLQKHGIEPPPTHEELAFMTGLNRVTVSRTLKEIYRNETMHSLEEYMEAGLLRE